MKSCSRCAGTPELLRDSGTLYLAPPLAHTLGVMRKSFDESGVPFDEPMPQILAVPIAPGRLDVVCRTLADRLGEIEIRDTRALILKEGEAFSLASVRETQPLATLMAKVQQRWLIPMIREGRLTTHFHPIVRVDAPREAFAHECLLRGKAEDGSLIGPMRMFDAARDADLMFPFDLAARLTSIREATAIGLPGCLFINFNPTAIHDPAFCLRSTVAAIRDAGIEPERVVFEVVESDQVAVDLLGIIDSYRRAGFRVALDDLGAGYGSLNLLARLRPDFVKLDMKLIRDVHQDRFKAGITSTILEMARKLGITTVAEGVETAEEWAWVRDHGAELVQGFYVARPGNPPPKPFSGGDLPPIDPNPGWSIPHAIEAPTLT